MDTKYEIIIFWSEEDHAYVAEVPELPGCMADGSTYQGRISTLGADASPATGVLDGFLGLPAGTLETFADGLNAFPGFPRPELGSAVKRTVDVPDGAVLTFDWNFVNGDPGVLDFGVFTVAPVQSGTPLGLATTADANQQTFIAGFTIASMVA